MKAKSIYLITLLFIGFVSSTFGQDTITIELSFTAKYDQEHIPLDSILIMNLTQGTEIVLYEPDTILEVDYIPFGTMINTGQDNSNNFSVSPNYPNPFKDQTSIDICLAEADNILIRIFDLSGREHVSYEKFMEAGKHTFNFYPGRENFYIFSVSYKGLTTSVKITNPTSGNLNCQLSYKGSEKQPSNLKYMAATNFLIYENDNMRYIGYAITPIWGVRVSDVVEDVPAGQNSTYQFDVLKGIPCVDLPTVFYGGKTYHTLQIGNQCWLKENINIGTMIEGIMEQTNNDTIEKYCYDDDPVNCDIYGGLYQWDEAMKYSLTPGVAGICPFDWHIPTDEEFMELEGTVDSHYGYPDSIWYSSGYRGYDVGKRLKSTSNWESTQGTNYVGFTALGTGCRFVDGTFMNMLRYTSMWTSNSFPTTAAYRFLEDWWVQSSRSAAPKNMGRSVRCLRNN